MQYLNIEFCRKNVFPFIHRNLTLHEPAPLYEEEKRGMGELEKVLTFIRNDVFYPTAEEKAAYLICSIAGSQYFSNGNKRLGVATLLFFLGLNGAEVELLDQEGYHTLLIALFPRAGWDNNSRIPDAHSLFLYNLALVIGNRDQRGSDGFDSLKQKVSSLFAHLYRIPGKGG